MTNIKDVANLARVSTASVSRYLKDPDMIKPELSIKIKDVIEKLDYKPSIIARSMRKQSSRFIALLVENISSPAYAEIIHGAEQYASENDYRVVVISIENEDKGKVLNDISTGNAFAGAILCQQMTLEDERYLNNLKNKDFPFVITHSETLKNKYLSVSNNNYKAAYDGIEFLIKKGHRKIALVELNSFIEVVNARKSGYLEALHDNSVSFDPSLCFNTDLSIEGGLEVGEKILKVINKFSAVFCLSDYIAIGLLKYFEKNDVKVPDMISILGFDDIEWSRVTTPALTTIHQRKKKLGYLSMSKLLSSINKKVDNDLSTVLDSYIVERDSVKEI